MRLGPMTVFMFVMYIMIGIFDQVFDPNLNIINGYGNTATDFAFATILQPWNWSGTINFFGFEVSSLILILGSAVTIAAGIALLGYVIGRSDIVLLFALFTAFMSLGAAPCIVLYSFVTRNVAMFACNIGETCGVANIFGALTAGVLAIMWLFTCMEWWAWRAATQ
jgi:hypothetical protein